MADLSTLPEVLPWPFMVCSRKGEVLFANPLALAACAADCVSSTVKLPIDEMFWCAGCQGSMYPMNGNVSASIGHVQASRLVLSRFAYKLHRELVAWGTMGGKGLCGKYLMPDA